MATPSKRKYVEEEDEDVSHLLHPSLRPSYYGSSSSSSSSSSSLRSLTSPSYAAGVALGAGAPAAAPVAEGEGEHYCDAYATVPSCKPFVTAGRSEDEIKKMREGGVYTNKKECDESKRCPPIFTVGIDDITKSYLAPSTLEMMSLSSGIAREHKLEELDWSRALPSLVKPIDPAELAYYSQTRHDVIPQDLSKLEKILALGIDQELPRRLLELLFQRYDITTNEYATLLKAEMRPEITDGIMKPDNIRWMLVIFVNMAPSNVERYHDQLFTLLLLFVQKIVETVFRAGNVADQVVIDQVRLAFLAVLQLIRLHVVNTSERMIRFLTSWIKQYPTLMERSGALRIMFTKSLEQLAASEARLLADPVVQRVLFDYFWPDAMRLRGVSLSPDHVHGARQSAIFQNFFIRLLSSPLSPPSSLTELKTNTEAIGVIKHMARLLEQRDYASALRMLEEHPTINFNSALEHVNLLESSEGSPLKREFIRLILLQPWVTDLSKATRAFVGDAVTEFINEKERSKLADLVRVMNDPTMPYPFHSNVLKELTRLKNAICPGPMQTMLLSAGRPPTTGISLPSRRCVQLIGLVNAIKLPVREQ